MQCEGSLLLIKLKATYMYVHTLDLELTQTYQAEHHNLLALPYLQNPFQRFGCEAA